MARPSLYKLNRDSLLVAIYGLSERGRTPTLREIGDVTGIPVSTLHSYIARMSDEGLVIVSSRSHRSIRLTELGREKAQGA